MRHREQEMQIRCVQRFRHEYPAYAWLLFHPKNEEAGGRTRAAIAKAEGVQAGVADLMFMIPNMDYHFLAIELKSKTGRQTPEQKLFQRYVTAAGGLYAVVRSDDDFWNVVSSYMENVGYTVRNRVEDLYEDVEAEKTAEARKVMNRILGKK